MNASVLSMTGQKVKQIKLPLIFETPFRRDIIHKTYINLDSHRFQPQGRHPTAGMDVVADTNNPPTGRGISRVARARGGGGGRQGQGAEVASTRGGRQAHPPIVEKVIYKRINKKEKRLALCSAIAATAKKNIVESRGHKVAQVESFPIIVSDTIEDLTKTSELLKTLHALNLDDDLQRLTSRKPRSGKSSLRGRGKKIGKSVLLLVHDSSNVSKAAGGLPGVEAKSVKDVSVLDLAPGSDPIRLVVYSESAIKDIENIQSTHLEIMVKMS